ncbi:MAG TPA: hypothetical protein PLA68_17440 [Panacibacter sp.]|nr:hypothetical protein [Panacibacter sp.]
MYNIAKFYNKITELYADCDMGHGIDDDTQTYFGTGLSSNADVGRYMAQRTAIFFQAVLAGKSTGDIGPPSLFTDCKNDRSLCIKNATTGCQDNDDCPSE